MTALAAKSHFELLRPRSVAEAVAMKQRHGESARYWAGGTDLVLLWQRKQIGLATCIDLSAVGDGRTIEVTPAEIRLGALATLTEIERSAARHPVLAVLSEVCKLMCTPQTRTIATVGGNLCNASPAADLSPCFVALDATTTLAGPSGERTLLLERFFTGVKRTALAPEEMMTGIHIPLPGRRLAVSYRRVARTVVDIALVNASCSLLLGEDGRIARARVALGAVAPVIVRSPEAERMLEGKTTAALDEALLSAAGRQAAHDAKPISDVRASADYRRHMVSVMVRRALTDCLARL